MKQRIYLDHNAATPVDPVVLAAVDHYLKNTVGNPSSIHCFGRECRQALTRSRDGIAAYLGVRPDEVIFTAGGTEGANMVIRGLFQEQSSGHIVTSNAEHSCVYNTVKAMEKLGCEATYLSPGEWGAVSPEQVENALKPDTRLIAIMAANNETGVKSDIEAIAAIAEQRGIPFFVDGVALLGKEAIHIPRGVSAMAFSGQKIHSIQGTGCCFIRKKLKLSPLITGGGHQFGRRAGTENLPGIVALAAAFALIQEELPGSAEKMRQMRDSFEQSLQQQLEEVSVNGAGPRVANTSNLYFKGVDGESLLTALDMEGVAVSHGSACSSGAIEPSRVLLNMGFTPERVDSSVRFSISRMTTQDELDAAVKVIVRVVTRLRSLLNTSSV